MFESTSGGGQAPSIPGLVYGPAFLTVEEERAALAAIDERPWMSDLKRRVQHYGYRYDYQARRISNDMHLGPLPDFARDVALKLLARGLVNELPDQAIVNEYLPGQGIAPHTDCVPCFGPVIVTVSLGGEVEMEFGRGELRQCIMLERRSALAMSGEARYEWTHAIRPRKKDHGVARIRRVSLTFRKVIVGA